MKLQLIILPMALVILLWQPGAAFADGTWPVQRLGNGVPTSLAASPDGAEVAAGSSIGIWLLDPQSLQPRRLIEMQESVAVLHYSVDGRYLQANQHIYDRAAGAWTHLDASAVAWIDPNCTHDGRYCFGDHKVAGIVYSRWVVDTVTGADIQELEPYVEQAAWAPDGSHFYALLYRNEIAAWAFRPGPGVAPWLAHLGGFFTDNMEVIYWSPDNTGISANDSIWDVASSQPAGHQPCPLYAPDLNRFDCPWPSTWIFNAYYIYLYDDALGFQYRVLTPHHVETTAFAQSGDGQWLATSGADAESAQEVQASWGTYQTYSITATSTRLWNRNTLSQIAQFPALFYQLAVSPHGELVVGIGDSDTEAWDTHTSQRLWKLAGHTNPACALEYYANFSWCWYLAGHVAFSPDGSLVALSAPPASNDILLVRSVSGQLVATLTGHTQSVSDLAFSPDGRRIAAGSSDGTVLIWNVPGGH